MLERIRNPAFRTLVYWHLGDRCNYKCSYCPSFLNDGSHGWNAVDGVKAAVSQIIYHYKARMGRHVVICFSGGEPTLYPHLMEVLQFIKKTDPTVVVTIVSNGSATIRRWRKIIPFLNHVILSYHHELSDLDHFETVCSLLHAEGKLLRIHCNMDPSGWEKCRSVYEELKGKGYTILAKALYVDFGEHLYQYSEEQMAYLKANMDGGINVYVTRDGVERLEPLQNLILRGENKYKGWLCSGGVEYISVRPHGEVLSAECGIRKQVIGNVNRADTIPLELPTREVVCDRDFCECLLDLALSKEKPTGASVL